MRKFQKIDYSTLQEWYQDPYLNKELGPLDEEWLEYVLHDSHGAQFCFWRSGELLCMIGIEWPTEIHNSLLISDIAVSPLYRRQGIGRQAINTLIQNVRAENYRAYVSESNLPAIQFFFSLKWKIIAKESEMLLFSNV